MSTTPRRLGRYELLQQLGRGNVGEVWKGYDLQLRREVVLKIIHTDLQSDPNFLLRFSKEGQLIASLHHTNIVQVHDVTHSRPSQQASEISAYIVSEYIEGETLTNYLLKTSHKGIFPTPSEIVYLFTSLGVAVDYAHQKGIVHGNIKPNNILLDKKNALQFEYGEPMLTDFGLDRLLGNNAGISSPYYMSPEQAKGQPANNRSDIYSLGVLLYELCTGVQPFRDDSSVAVMMQHINTLPTPPILINSSIPPALSEVILRAMAKDTATRFAMASLLAIAVADAYSIQSTIKVTRPMEATVEEESTYYGHSTSPTGPQTSILGVSQPLPKLPPREPGSSPSMPAAMTPPSTQSGNSGKYAALRSSSITGKLPVANSSTGKIPVVPDSTDKTSVSATSTSTGKQYPVTLPGNLASPQTFPAAQKKATEQRKGFRFTDTPTYVIIAALLVLLLIIGAAIGTNLFLNSKGHTGTSTIVGQVFFEDDAMGHADTLRIELHNVPTPQQGKSYMGWIAGNANTILPIGSLVVENGSITAFFAGDDKHTNLVSITQSVFVTLEDSGNQATQPKGPQLYKAQFDPASLQYIKNILYTTPGFPGDQGIVVGLFETIKSMNDKAGSIVDSIQATHDYALATRQATRIIEMLDGTKYAMQNGDLPANLSSLLNTPVGLLSSSAQIGYIDALSKQVGGLEHAIGNNSTQLTHIQHVKNAIHDLQDWLQKIRTYDVQLLKATRLSDPTSLGVALQLKQTAADAYTGRTIPPNGGPLPILGSAGAYQAYIECQYLATLDMKQV